MPQTSLTPKTAIPFRNLSYETLAKIIEKGDREECTPTEAAKRLLLERAQKSLQPPVPLLPRPSTLTTPKPPTSKHHATRSSH